MATRTFPSNKSSLFANSGSTDLGGGADQHLPVGGLWNGYNFTAAIRFALDYSGMVRITAATLRLRTSTQVHVGFSSSPDFYAARCTSDWTANGSAESWGTSPTVYPGPAFTSTGKSSKRASTSESVWVEMDLLAIVRAWAPASVEGGGGAANYGIRLNREASGDITEFLSYRASSNRPEIVVTYDTDAPPPAPTVTGPTGTVTTLRPTLTAVAVDPDGDPLQAGDVEVRKAAAVVYSKVAFAAAGATSLSHVPTADLPSGALTVRFRAQAAGVYGAWSAEAPFTVDRPPVMGAWSAPAATVSGTRRPVHTVAWSDPDGDAGQAYDLEVYGASGGAPSGSAVYAKTNQTTGLTASSISHTPASDLPGGELVARVRVKAAGVWSAWSSYRAYTVVLTVPTLTWNSPGTDGGFLSNTGDWANVANAMAVWDVYGQIAYAPPAGQTITRVHVKTTVAEATPGSPAVGTILIDSDISSPVPAGGVYTRMETPGATWIYGAIRFEFEVFASGGGTSGKQSRVGRFAFGEWYGAVALGDQAGPAFGLTAVEVPLGDQVRVWYRAQTSPTAAAGAAPWRDLASLPGIEGELPDTNAYLGVRTRIVRKADDTQLCLNPSFEDGIVNGKPDVWAHNWGSGGASFRMMPDATAPDGAHVLRISCDGVVGYASVTQGLDMSEIVPGATYRLSGYAKRFGAGTMLSVILLRTRNASGGVIADINAVATNAGTWTFGEVWWTAPTDGSVASAQIYTMVQLVPVAGAGGDFDNIRFEGMTVGDAGMDRLELAWNSLG